MILANLLGIISYSWLSNSVFFIRFSAARNCSSFKCDRTRSPLSHPRSLSGNLAPCPLTLFLVFRSLSATLSRTLFTLSLPTTSFPPPLISSKGHLAKSVLFVNRHWSRLINVFSVILSSFSLFHLVFTGPYFSSSTFAYENIHFLSLLSPPPPFSLPFSLSVSTSYRSKRSRTLLRRQLVFQWKSLNLGGCSFLYRVTDLTTAAWWRVQTVGQGSHELFGSVASSSDVFRVTFVVSLLDLRSTVDYSYASSSGFLPLWETSDLERFIV